MKEAMDDRSSYRPPTPNDKQSTGASYTFCKQKGSARHNQVSFTSSTTARVTRRCNDRRKLSKFRPATSTAYALLHAQASSIPSNACTSKAKTTRIDVRNTRGNRKRTPHARGPPAAHDTGIDVTVSSRVLLRVSHVALSLGTHDHRLEVHLREASGHLDVILPQKHRDDRFHLKSRIESARA